MHITVYICIVCVRSHACVRTSITLANVSGATLFALLRGPSVHDGLEAKMSALFRSQTWWRLEQQGRQDWYSSFPIQFDSTEICSGRFCFFLVLEVQSPSLLLVPPFHPAVVGFLHFNAFPLFSPFDHMNCLFVESLPLNSMNLVPLQSINSPPPTFFKKFCMQILTNSHGNLSLCFWVKVDLKTIVCLPNHTAGTEVCHNYMHNYIFSIYNI